MFQRDNRVAAAALDIRQLAKDIFTGIHGGFFDHQAAGLSSGLAAKLLARGELALLVLRAGDLADARARHTLARPEVRRILATEFAYRRSGDFLFYERRGAR